jgi:hypothetical protein
MGRFVWRERVEQQTNAYRVNVPVPDRTEFGDLGTPLFKPKPDTSLAILLRRENPPPDSYIEWAPHSGAMLSRKVRGDTALLTRMRGLKDPSWSRTRPRMGRYGQSGEKRPCGPRILGG